MIKVTRLNQVPLFLNSDLIEHIDAMPDTIVSLTSGQKFLVAETPEEVVEKIVAFRKLIIGDDLLHLAGASRSVGTTSTSHGR
jgi:flagellar protein FlbD